MFSCSGCWAAVREHSILPALAASVYISSQVISADVNAPKLFTQTLVAITETQSEQDSPQETCIYNSQLQPQITLSTLKTSIYSHSLTQVLCVSVCRTVCSSVLSVSLLASVTLTLFSCFKPHLKLDNNMTDYPFVE